MASADVARQTVANLNVALSTIAALQQKILAIRGEGREPPAALVSARDAIRAPLRAALLGICEAQRKAGVTGIRTTIPTSIFTPEEIRVDSLADHPCWQLKTVDEFLRLPPAPAAPVNGLGLIPLIIAVAAVAWVAGEAVYKILSSVVAVEQSGIARDRSDFAGKVLEDYRSGKLTKEQTEDLLKKTDQGYRTPDEVPPGPSVTAVVGWTLGGLALAAGAVAFHRAREARRGGTPARA